MIEFLLYQVLDSKEEEDYDYILDSLVRQGKLENVKLAVEKIGEKMSPDAFTSAIAGADEKGYLDIAEYLEEYIQRYN